MMYTHSYNNNDKVGLTHLKLWQSARQDPLDETVMSRKWTWIGHTLRKFNSMVPSKSRLVDGPSRLQTNGH